MALESPAQTTMLTRGQKRGQIENFRGDRSRDNRSLVARWTPLAGFIVIYSDWRDLRAVYFRFGEFECFGADVVPICN